MGYYIIISEITEPRTSRTVHKGPIESANVESAVDSVRASITADTHGGSEDITVYELAIGDSGDPVTYEL